MLIWSTNLPGFDLVAEMEAETGVPVIDSCTVGIAAALAEIGVEAAPQARSDARKAS